MKLLKNKNILLGVTSSIAIYKSLELIRLYIKSGANVRVVTSKNTTKFISALTFETISRNKVLNDKNEDWSSNSINNHIAIGKWADIFVIAPATANTINKLSNGIADNLLLQTALAYHGIKLLCPAANTNMIHNPITQASIKMLTICNFEIIDSVSKELACQDIGDGAMASIENIFHKTCRILLKNNYWEDRRIVLNGGGTIEKIDDIRYISNFSSGKMASSLATALYYLGASVCLVTTKVTSNIPKEIHIIEVEDTKEMLEYIQSSLNVAKKGKIKKASLIGDEKISLIQKKPYFFAVAAVSDYIPKYPQNGKIKKENIGSNWNIELQQNIDILNSIDKTNIYSIGFKAETNAQEANKYAKNMLATKNLDVVCLNIINNSNKIGGKTNNLEIVVSNSSNIKNISGDKLNISLELLNYLETIFNE